ncbi:MAG: hypothetical protein HN742_25045 [Lentisphaerae bacterium]|jgi:hypothetical protein|nr:hypothetical protein [Lentisphaerota bacterium]MBT4817647.1 hypothetical protein [Lentisphaerota bacterium]MBT5607547.1 hypothetical protein [Lentisphaerota bacterium]MBT7054592.1 hypothetical protein [Lentisphaerota bacterium]MBT7845169.1 hypothetical protein [Lentisphaerota bacterium]
MAQAYYRALGALAQNGQRADDVFVGKMMLDRKPYKALVRNKARQRELPGRKFFAMGWADFFDDDELYIMPLLAKYGFTSDFYAQMIPLTDEPLGSHYDIERFKRIFASGNHLGDHGIHHNVWIALFPTFDGFNTPSNDDFRRARDDGTNAFGHAVSKTLNDAMREVFVAYYLKDASLGDKAFAELTDDDCDYLRRKLSFFRSDADYRTGQDQLKCLDQLSNRYCGTTGTSVFEDDYGTRIPNTQDLHYPSEANRVLGGIYQGAATLQNHEVWERLETIYAGYMSEVMGLDHPLRFWAIPGGVTYSLFYRKVGAADGDPGYADRECTVIGSGFGRHHSSITGQTRGFMDVLRAFGYRTTMAGCLLGFGDRRVDARGRREGQYQYKLNSRASRRDYVGDGFWDSLRHFDPGSGDRKEVVALLESDDAMLRRYEETKGKNSAHTTRDNYAQVVEEICRKIAQGLIPQAVEDSGINPGPEQRTRRAHSALTIELIYQFCLKAGIEIISHTEASDVAFRELPKGVNIFPNADLATTVRDVIASDLAPVCPDGWDRGEVETGSGERVATFTERSHVRSYLIQNGVARLAADVRGHGVLNVYFIRNDHLVDGSEYLSERAGTLTISGAELGEYSLNFTIPDVPLRTYTDEPQDQRDYFRGLDDKICGLHIEVVPAPGETITIRYPNLIVR